MLFLFPLYLHAVSLFLSVAICACLMMVSMAFHQCELLICTVTTGLNYQSAMTADSSAVTDSKAVREAPLKKARFLKTNHVQKHILSTSERPQLLKPTPYSVCREYYTRTP